MKPGVEDSSTLINPSCTSTSKTFSTRLTTPAINSSLKIHINAGRDISLHRRIAGPLNSAIALPPIVPIVTAISWHGPNTKAQHSVDGANGPGPSADIDVSNHYGSAPQMHTVTPPLCDPVHSIEHRMALFAYRGLQKRHHQGEKETCSQL